MKPSVLVTGAAGFIGSHLCEALVEEGFFVIGVDDLSSGHLDRLSAVIDRMEFIRGNILDSSVLDQACSVRSKPEVIFHLAAVPSVISSIEEPEISHHANINGTFQILMAAKKHGVRRVIYSASSSVYGQSSEEYKTEDLCPDLISPYGLQKWVGEKYCELFMKYHQIETIALRYFNVFGPRQDPNSLYAAVIPKFITSVLDNSPVTIHGDGLQSRDFTYVTNIVEGNLLALRAPKEACGRAYNLALGKSETLLSLLEAVEGIIGKKSQRVFAPSRAGDIRDSKASIELAVKMLGYKPAVDFQEGLRLTIEAFKNKNHQ